MESILTSIKEMLGMGANYDHFDHQLVAHINTALTLLTGLGVGPSEGYLIRNKEDKWTDFVPENPKLESIKTYVYLNVKMLFDPPVSAAAIDAIERSIKKLEWLINVTADSKGDEEA